MEKTIWTDSMINGFTGGGGVPLLQMKQILFSRAQI